MSEDFYGQPHTIMNLFGNAITRASDVSFARPATQPRGKSTAMQEDDEIIFRRLQCGAGGKICGEPFPGEKALWVQHASTLMSTDGMLLPECFCSSGQALSFSLHI